MRIKISFLSSLLFLIFLGGCNINNDQLPSYGSKNNYEYTFIITTTSGTASMLLNAKTDGEEVLLNNKEKSESTPAQFYIRIGEGETKRYIVSSKAAKRYSVEVRIEPSNVKGYWKFEERVNGKLVKTDRYQFNLNGRDEKHSITYHSSTID